MRFLRILTFTAHLLFLKFGLVSAQEQSEIYNSKNRYLLLLDQFNLYKAYYQDDAGEIGLINEAEKFAGDQDFEIAIVYLEEAIASLKASDNDTPVEEGALITGKKAHITPSGLDVLLLSGIDFNRQEFEVGFLESDSTVLEEISKPYFGIHGIYSKEFGQASRLEISNAIRYDNENWRDDYYIRWSAGRMMRFEYRGFWNKSKDLETNTFWEHDIDVRFDSGYRSDFNWMIQNNYIYKNYRESNTLISDYYRNRLNGLLEWSTAGGSIIGIEGISEKNETLGRDDYDYWQNNIRVGYRRSGFREFNYSIRADGGIRDYKIQFEDSIIVNTYTQLGAELYLDIPVSGFLKLEVDDNLVNKVYRQKSTLEPDYLWNHTRGALGFILSNRTEILVGYEYELKRHKDNQSDTYDVTEQDYDAGGIFLSLNYFSEFGTYFSATISYLQRRYPEGLTNDLISIYSDRNIFTAMILSYIPITEKLRINAFATFDNDDDIDLDQQSNQSIIYNIELEYKL